MNRNIFIAIVWLALGAGLKASAQQTNAGAALDWSSFQSISQKNIFDPTRGGTRRITAAKRAALVRTFTFRGTIDDAALFTGEGTPQKGYVMAGDLINGYKVMQVTLDDVKLAEPGGNIVLLKTDDTMRREDDGPWAKSDQAAPAPAPAVGAGIQMDESPASSGPASPPSTAINDVLEKLRQRHKQE
jgi:hypothetical protein